MDGHLLSQGWVHRNDHQKYGYQPSKRWSLKFQIMIPRMVKHHPQEYNPPSKGFSPTNPRKAIHHHQDGYPLPTVQWYGCTPSPVWSPNSSRMVTHHLQDGQLDLEFDSSAAKLVNLVVTLVSSSVALPAQLVSFFFHTRDSERSSFS